MNTTSHLTMATHIIAVLHTDQPCASYESVEESSMINFTEDHHMIFQEI